jgi:hypothetical protein
MRCPVLHRPLATRASHESRTGLLQCPLGEYRTLVAIIRHHCLDARRVSSARRDDVSEHRRLDGIERIVGVAVWFAYVPPEEAERCYLFRNRNLNGRLVVPIWRSSLSTRLPP